MFNFFPLLFIVSVKPVHLIGDCAVIPGNLSLLAFTQIHIHNRFTIMGKSTRSDNRLKELGITMADVEAFKKHRATLRRGGRSKESTKDPSAYDEYAEVAK